MIGFKLEPIDTLFFRDGTPFSSDSSSQDEVGGQFPPSPFTVVGAMKAALARCAGWDGHSQWSSDVMSILGEGADDLGTLSFTGPFVVYEDERGSKLLFPVPRHLVGDTTAGTWVPRAFLRPGRPTLCDLGDCVLLPDLPKEDRDHGQTLEATDELWVTEDGFSSILMYRLPDVEDLIKPPWEPEPRIGLRIDSKTRTAMEAQLYSSQHIRLKNGAKLAVFIDGIPETWDIPDRQLVPLGGESRVAECIRWDAHVHREAPISAIASTGRIALVALTPVDMNPPLLGEQLRIPECDADIKVVSACIDRPLRVGGWDSSVHSPLPLSSYIPPGSVIFCEATDTKALASYIGRTASNGYLRIGNRQSHGFGLVAITTWSSEE